MTKEIKKEENKLPAKKYTQEEAKKILISMMSFEGDLGFELNKFAEDILPKLFNGSDKEKKEAEEKMLKNAMPILQASDSETQWALMGTFIPEYRSLARETTRQIIKDYNCSNSIEKALAEVIANAHVRIIDNSRRLNNRLDCKTADAVTNAYLSILSKQTDRAYRQFFTALITLKQIKAPVIEMNIKAHTAFVSDKQQINLNNSKDEIIKP